MNELLSEGIAAAKAGQRQHARGLLLRVLEQDRGNATAWLWLSGVMDTLEEQEVCLKNVLILDPDDAAARKGLAWVQQQKQALAPSPAAGVARGAVVEPRPFSAARMDEFDDEYLCPYCATPTGPHAGKCSACGGDLWVRFRRQEKWSNALWFAVGAQVASLIRNASSLVPMLALTQFLIQEGDTVSLALAYLGLPNGLPPETVSSAFVWLPRSVFLAHVFFSLFSLIVLIGLALRLRPAFYLFLADAAMSLVAAIVALSLRGIAQAASYVVLPTTGLVFFYLTSGAGVILALLKGYLAFQVQDDLLPDKRRLLLRVDPGLISSPDLVARADFYVNQRMWAMAVVHLRQAVDLVFDRIDCHLALAAAYIRLKRYELAGQILAEAGRIAPGDPRVAELEALLFELRSEGGNGNPA